MVTYLCLCFQSGLLVHLQLVQVQPGLCEIGSDQEETQRLIQEQQQLTEKLKVQTCGQQLKPTEAAILLLTLTVLHVSTQRHESKVLSGVENGRQAEQRRRRRKDEEEVYTAMGASLREGWSLLLHLLDKRQEVLMLASDFYHRAQEVGRRSHNRK